MCRDGEAFQRYAKAEKELCEKTGAVLTQIIREIEDRYGIRIAELRVTMGQPNFASGWHAANCVMVREQEVPAAHETRSRSVERRPTAASRGRASRSMRGSPRMRSA